MGWAGCGCGDIHRDMLTEMGATERWLVSNLKAVQVQCSILDAWGWCTGMTHGDGTGREKGRGFRMGNTCTPVVDSC